MLQCNFTEASNFLTKATTLFEEHTNSADNANEYERALIKGLHFVYTSYKHCIATCIAIATGDDEEIKKQHESLVSFFKSCALPVEQVVPVIVTMTKLLVTISSDDHEKYCHLALLLTEQLWGCNKLKSNEECSKNIIKASILDMLNNKDEAQKCWQLATYNVPLFINCDSFSRVFDCSNAYFSFKKAISTEQQNTIITYQPEYKLTLHNKQHPVLINNSKKGLCKLQITFDGVEKPQIIELKKDFLAGEIALNISQPIEATKMEHKMFKVFIQLFNSIGDEIDSITQLVVNNFSYCNVKTYKQLEQKQQILNKKLMQMNL